MPPAAKPIQIIVIIIIAVVALSVNNYFDLCPKNNAIMPVAVFSLSLSRSMMFMAACALCALRSLHMGVFWDAIRAAA